jgi:hypothetical protein
VKTRGVIGIATGAVLLFFVVTWWALQSGEVVVLRTRDANGALHETRVWLAADESGALWIEAANPERRWCQDLLARPEVGAQARGTTARSGGTRDRAAAPRRTLWPAGLLDRVAG